MMIINAPSLRKEMEQLSTRLNMLNSFLDKTPSPVNLDMDERLLLTEQAIVMHEYLVILNKRMGLLR